MELSVPRHHACLKDDHGAYKVDDLTAARSEPNPVLVNGIEKEHAVLSDGDEAKVGGISFRFHKGSQALAA